MAARRVRRVRSRAAQRLPRPAVRRRPALRHAPSEPELGQLLFPERRMPGRRTTPRCTATAGASRRGCSTSPKPTIEQLGPPDLQAAARRRGDAVAPGRGVLGRRPLVPRGRRVDAARRHRRRQRLPVVRARARTGARCSRTATSATTPPCTSSSSPTRSTLSAAVPVPLPRRRRQLPPPAHDPRRRARTRPTGRGGRGRTSSSSRRSTLDVPADRPWVQEGHDAMRRTATRPAR